MVENTGSKEEAKQNDIVIVNEEKSDTQPSGEIKDSSKLEQHKLGDVQLLKQKEQVAQEQTEQATTENSKPSIETAAPEKSTSKPIPHRASANIPIGKKPATQKQLTSPPKHMTPKSTANLQSEFRQAGFEIDDGFDSDDNQTFSELRRDEASTTSLDDSLKGSESFVSLDNYKEVGSQKQKSSRVGSAKERDRKHSQESETQLKEQRKSSQDYEARLKESSSVAAAAVQREEVIQKPTASLATEILQASETGNSSSTVEPSPLLASNGDFDSMKDKGADSLVEGTAAKKSAILTDQRKPTVTTTTADDDSSEDDDDDDDDDDVMIKGDDVVVYIHVWLCIYMCGCVYMCLYKCGWVCWCAASVFISLLV